MQRPRYNVDYSSQDTDENAKIYSLLYTRHITLWWLFDINLNTTKITYTGHIQQCNVRVFAREKHYE